MDKKGFRESKNYELWLKNARYDLEGAVILFDQNSHTGLICYHAHQTVEKALKAYLIYNGNLSFPHTHDLIVLLERARHYLSEFENFEEEISRLNRYYLETKYPPDIPLNYPRKEAKQAIDDAKEILDFVKNNIKTDRS